MFGVVATTTNLAATEEFTLGVVMTTVATITLIPATTDFQTSVWPLMSVQNTHYIPGL